MSDTTIRLLPFPTRKPYDGALIAPERKPAAEFSRGEKVALLRLRRSAWSEAVLDHLRAFGGDDCSGADYRALATRELAICKGSFHVLTQCGRWTADRIAMDIARAENMHAVSYTPARRGAAASARCACGWSTYASAHIPGHMNTLYRHGRAHLQRIGQYMASEAAE